MSKKRIVAVHVRQGDACQDSLLRFKKCFPLSVYMNKVMLLEQKYGKYDAIFLATDSQQIINSSKRYEQPELGGFKFISQDFDRSVYDDEHHRVVDERIDLNKPEFVEQIATDIWAMAHCDAFIGSFSSSVAWVSYEVMLARKGFYPPFISVHLSPMNKKSMGHLIRRPNLG